jgi:hypothetical protein
MRFIDPAGRRVNRSDDSMGVIDHPVVFVPWPSLEPVLTNQRGFWIGVALILLVYFRTRTWSGHIRVLIVIGPRSFYCLLRRASQFVDGKLVGFDSESQHPAHEPSSTMRWHRLSCCSDALRHDPAEECNEDLLPPALAGFAQYAVIRNRVVQAITQEPQVIESFRDNPHPLSFAAHVIQKHQQHHLHDDNWIF